MRYLNRTIIVLVVFCLATTTSAMLQSPEGKIQTFTISGNTGISGVAMIGLPGDPVTDEHGLYCTEVEYGWSGTVKPTIEGYSFVPASKEYSNVIADQTDQNYQAKLITFTISGRVMIPSVAIQNLPPVLLSSIVMQGLPGNTITDNTGDYGVSVPYGWTGTVEPAKEGYTFMPARREYTKVTMDLSNQNYAAITVDKRLDSQLQEFFGDRYVGTGSDGRRRGRSTSSREDIYGSMGSAGQTRGFSNDRRRTRTGIGPVAGRKILVVPATEVNSKELAEIIEDMQIMSHILDERFKETRRVQGVFTDFGDFFGRDNRQTEAIYLQGYGVLFSMEVNFAFSPQPKPQPQQTAEPNEQVDSTWLKAKQQVFSPGESRGPDGPDSAEEYNSQMVEELKRDLITTLKHAANIRDVQPNEWIILTVIGSGRLAGGFGGGGLMMGGMGGYGSSGYGGAVSGGYAGGYSYSGGYSDSGGSMGGGTGGFGMSGFGGSGASAATVLTIRAKKSDIDTFAKDQQDYEQFRQKVEIFTY
jgi:hypothetical protein